MFFMNSARTLCHVIEDMRTGEAPQPCGSKADKLDLMRYREGQTNQLLQQKPPNVRLCKHCEKGLKSS